MTGKRNSLSTSSGRLERIVEILLQDGQIRYPRPEPKTRPSKRLRITFGFTGYLGTWAASTIRMLLACTPAETVASFMRVSSPS